MIHSLILVQDVFRRIVAHPEYASISVQRNLPRIYRPYRLIPAVTLTLSFVHPKAPNGLPQSPCLLDSWTLYPSSITPQHLRLSLTTPQLHRARRIFRKVALTRGQSPPIVPPTSIPAKASHLGLRSSKPAREIRCQGGRASAYNGKVSFHTRRYPCTKCLPGDVVGRRGVELSVVIDAVDVVYTEAADSTGAVRCQVPTPKTNKYEQRITYASPIRNSAANATFCLSGSRSLATTNMGSKQAMKSCAVAMVIMTMSATTSSSHLY